MRLPFSVNTGWYARSIGLAVATHPNFPTLQKRINKYGIEDAPRRVRAANRESVKWLSNAARVELERRIQATGREQNAQEPLVNVVRDYNATSTFSENGFKFFKSDKVDKTPVRRYWRVIERGSRYWVERSERTGEGLIFFGAGADGSSGLVRAGANRLAGSNNVALIKPNGRRRGAQIRRPIPAYNYLQTAVTAFESNNVYRDKLAEQFKGTRIRFRR